MEAHWLNIIFKRCGVNWRRPNCYQRDIDVTCCIFTIYRSLSPNSDKSRKEFLYPDGIRIDTET